MVIEFRLYKLKLIILVTKIIITLSEIGIIKKSIKTKLLLN